MSHKWAAGYITLAARAVPTASSGLQNQRWATSGPGGYITSTTWEGGTAGERGSESKVGHKWSGWLHNLAALGVRTASQRGAELEVAT